MFSFFHQFREKALVWGDFYDGVLGTSKRIERFFFDYDVIHRWHRPVLKFMTSYEGAEN